MDVGSRTQRVISIGRRGLYLLWLLCLPSLGAAAGQGPITVIADRHNPVHQRFIAALRENLPATAVLELADDRPDRKALQDAALLLSVGTRGARTLDALALQMPIINSLVTEADGQRLGGQGARTRLYIDQPPARLLALVKQALPGRERVTVALGPSSRRAQGAVQQGCVRLVLRCTTVLVNDEAGIEQALQQAAGSGKVLLVLPDAQVVNADSAQLLILGAYRRGVALVGYSRALVKAGALMAVHSTPGQLGEDAARVVQKVLARGAEAMPASRYPARYTVSVNYQLAHALGLSIDSESALAQAIHRGEQHE